MSSDKDPAPRLPEERPQSGSSRPLADLLAYVAEQAPHKYAGQPPSPVLPGEIPEIDFFQKTWSRLSTGLRIKQSQSQVPENAGPLNSSQLIYRSLLLMQERSPGYLRHFLSSVDTLSWLEQMGADSSLPAKKAAPAKAAPAKAAPAKAATKAPTKAAKSPARTPTKKAPRKAR